MNIKRNSLINEDNIYMENAKFLIIFMYIKFLIYPLKFAVNSDSFINAISGMVTVAIGLYLLNINKFKISNKFIIFILSILLLFMLNIFLVDYKSIVTTEMLNFIIYNIIIIYIISQGINFKHSLNIWYKIAIYTTIVSPIYMIMVSNKMSSYMFYGIYMSYSFCIILLYYIKTNKKINLPLLMYILVSTMIYGNRSAVLTMIMSIIIFNLLFQEKYTKKVIFIILISLLSIFAVIYQDQLISETIRFLTQLDLKTYSINKYLLQLNKGLGSALSGRDFLYNDGLRMISESKGLPLGIGYFENATGIRYPHNFFIDFFIVFGIYGGIILLSSILISSIKTFINFDKYGKQFMILIFIVSSVRLMFSSTFIVERNFWIIISLLVFAYQNIGINKIKDSDEKYE